jgi:hypothetical protein
MEMKNIFAGLLAAAVFAGCATGPQASRDEYDIVPEKSEVKTPTAVEWENANDAQLKAETTPAALHAYLKSAAAADALLAEVKGAYKTDPMTATKIHAVGQLVMSPKTPENRKCRPAECRDLWTAALLRAAKASTDPYRTMFLLDQLRWCGKPSHAAEIRAIGAASDAAEVKAFSHVVARELEGLPLAR